MARPRVNSYGTSGRAGDLTSSTRWGAIAGRSDDDVRQIRWMIQELRVSYFAQTLGTPYSISDKRIRKAMDQL